jgi:hypothetical protein
MSVIVHCSQRFSRRNRGAKARMKLLKNRCERFHCLPLGWALPSDMKLKVGAMLWQQVASTPAGIGLRL